jgi:hypothetical protein
MYNMFAPVGHIDRGVSGPERARQELGFLHSGLVTRACQARALDTKGRWAKMKSTGGYFWSGLTGRAINRAGEAQEV